MTARAAKRGWNLRIATVKVTARRFSVTYPGHRRPDHTLPHFARATGFPERCWGVYRLRVGKLMGVVYRDGDRLIKKLDDWIAKGYQSEPCQGRRS